MNCCVPVKLQKNTYNTMSELLNLPSNALENLYAGEKCGRILILNYKRIVSKTFIMQVRDLAHRDDYVCQEERFMTGMIPGDLIEVDRAVCIKIPELGRTSVLLGPIKLIARGKDADWTHLSDAIPLPSHITALN